jgi:hypothetical protein
MPKDQQLEVVNAQLVEDLTDTPDAEALSEERYYCDDRTHQSRMRNLEFREASQNLKARLDYAKYIFGLTCAWVLLIYALLLLDGFASWQFHLSDAVILAAIGSTTANVIGLLYIVVNYFFPAKVLSKPAKKPSSTTKPSSRPKQ